MRIISGELKGRKLIIPKNLTIKPTKDIVRESFFNIIQNYFNLNEISALDLFAGSGFISYEFASRDCKDITCVDIEYNCCKFIIDTSKKLNIKDKINTFHSDYLRFILKTKKNSIIIYCDPPFNSNYYNKILEIIFSKKILSDNGWLILEHPINLSFSKHPNFFDQRRYGKVLLSMFKYQNNE